MINFAGYLFSDPVPLSAFRAPDEPGLCCLMVRDERWSPLPFRPVYFGQTGNRLDQSEDQGSASGEPAGALYASSFAPIRQSFARELIEEFLIASFKPLLNVRQRLSEERLDTMDNNQAREVCHVVA